MFDQVPVKEKERFQANNSEYKHTYQPGLKWLCVQLTYYSVLIRTDVDNF